MFTPHPNLADDVNHAIIQSEIEGGVFLHDLPPSTILHIQTMHHCYTAVLLGGTTFQGGRGGILGTLAGVLILVVAFNLVNILGLNFNLQLVLRHATLVDEFPLPDDAEPAPVFHA